MRFAKLHGLGNDFVLVDLRGAPAPAALPDEAFARRACDRNFGVGADGVLTLVDEEAAAPQIVGTPSIARARLVIHNPDGSRPEMCGNGARCAALWLATDGCTRPARARVRLLTDAGPRLCEVEAERPELGQVEIGMGTPRVEAPRELKLQAARAGWQATPVSMGNPHLVLFFEHPHPLLDARDLADLCRREGPRLCLEENANIEFVNSLGPQRFATAVWERGAGATLACGTGACAVAAAAIARGLARAELPIAVELPGGALTMRMRGDELLMRGPAQLVFTGALA